jgi:hypothetical protein
MGIINDDRMESRVQVTLVVTGLGAPTLEETVTDLAQSNLSESQVPNRGDQPRIDIPTTERQPVEAIPISQPLNTATASNNLDLPAFLRRRNRSV